jgi:hypothetical protein
LHSEEFHILYSSSNIIRQIKARKLRSAGHVARKREERNVYMVLMGKSEDQNEDWIRMDLREIGWGV